jgi:hypothetical protein
MTPVRNFKMLTPSPGSNNRQGVTLINGVQSTDFSRAFAERDPTKVGTLNAVRPGHTETRVA